jgi:hypothetical protein
MHYNKDRKERTERWLIPMKMEAEPVKESLSN